MIHIALSLLSGIASVGLFCSSANNIMLSCLWAFLAVAQFILGIKEIAYD